MVFTIVMNGSQREIETGRIIGERQGLSFFKNAAYRGSLCRFFSWGCTFVMSRLGSCSA